MLQVDSMDLESMRMTFSGEVHKAQTYRLEPNALACLHAYLAKDQTKKSGPMLLATLKSGHLTYARMTARNMSQRLRFLFAQAGLEGVSAHDLRHYWATQAARHNTPLDRLKEAGGWASVSMPLRYVEAAQIANEGVKLREK